MPKATRAKPDNLDHSIEAVMERVIREFLHSELVRHQDRDLASLRNPDFGPGDRTHLARASNGAPC